MEGEHDVEVQELNLSNDQLVAKKVRVDVVEASLVAMSIYLDRSIVDCIDLCHLLAEAQSQRKKDFARV